MLKKLNWSSKILAFATMLIAGVSLSCLCACQQNKEIVHEFSLGEGLETVTLTGDYYSVNLTNELKQDGAVAMYQNDGDEPTVIMYRFPWKEEGDYSSYIEYFQHEAFTYDTSIHYAWLENANKFPCQSFVHEEDFQGKHYMSTCYGFEDGEDIVEVLYLNKLDEVKIPGSEVKLYIPRKIGSEDISETEDKTYMVDKRVSYAPYFPTVFTYTWKNSDTNSDIYSDDVMGYFSSKLKADSIEKVEINGFKGFKGTMLDSAGSSFNIYVYECNGYYVEMVFSSVSQDGKAYEDLIGKSIH